MSEGIKLIYSHISEINEQSEAGFDSKCKLNLIY